jgi:hypothetical protein
MITFLFALVILGAVLYLVEHFIPMAEPIRIVIRIVVVLILIWYLLRMVGMAPNVPL